MMLRLVSKKRHEIVEEYLTKVIAQILCEIYNRNLKLCERMPLQNSLNPNGNNNSKDIAKFVNLHVDILESTYHDKRKERLDSTPSP
jgi:hypothetical protein